MTPRHSPRTGIAVAVATAICLVMPLTAHAQQEWEGADFQRRLDHARNKLLAEAMLQAEVKAAVTNEAMRKVYDDAAKAQKPAQEIHARHILVVSENEAKDALKRVKAGEDFAAAARRVALATRESLRPRQA